jgi:ethanolamine utilization protein EutA (predicted chaperonin)
VSTAVVTIDGLALSDLYYIDVGTAVAASGVVSVTVKSLVFQEGC